MRNAGLNNIGIIFEKKSYKNLSVGMPEITGSLESMPIGQLSAALLDQLLIAKQY